jgi:hypothetical protein
LDPLQPPEAVQLSALDELHRRVTRSPADTRVREALRETAAGPLPPEAMALEPPLLDEELPPQPASAISAKDMSIPTRAIPACGVVPDQTINFFNGVRIRSIRSNCWALPVGRFHPTTTELRHCTSAASDVKEK